MRLFTTISGLRCFLDCALAANRAIEAPASASTIEPSKPDVGFVPTMGALHRGHLSLIERARQENQLVVVSIFVNPLQFGPQEDFQQYPRDLEHDQQLCEHAGVDVLFVPSIDELVPQSSALSLPSTQVVPPDAMTEVLCGRTRIGHFQGVATIITKLFNLVQPTRAYFGQKDAQQLAVLRRMVGDLNLPVEILTCPTVREASGLAMSSRNQYLTAEQKQQAIALYHGLQQAAQAFYRGERTNLVLVEAVKAELEKEPAIVPEYVELVHPVTLAPLAEIEEGGLLAIAARLGTTRLIDNMVLTTRRPIVAIDGPAGAGKSTVARLVAQALGLLYLDTGAMYRAITWLVMQSSAIALTDEPAIAELVSQTAVVVSGDPLAVQVSVNGEDVTQAIRSLEVTANVSAIAAQPAVRKELVKQQRRYGQRGGVVIEGRDIGTYVFPDAEVKIFLTASAQERARRRQQDLINQGKGEVSLDMLEQSILERDFKDSNRALAPLKKAIDAIELNTDPLTIPQVVDRIVQLYQERIAIARCH